MNTAYYTFTSWTDGRLAAGFGGGLDGTRRTSVTEERPRGTRPTGGDNVIDLSAWRAANLSAFEEEPDQAAEELSEPDIPAPRPRKSRRAALAAELISTASVALAALVIIVQVLTF